MENSGLLSSEGNIRQIYGLFGLVHELFSKAIIVPGHNSLAMDLQFLFRTFLRNRLIFSL